MTTLQRLAEWRDAEIISAEQHDVLSALERRTRFSLFGELQALLYGGVLAIAAGVLWTVQAHARELGDVAILAGLSTLLAATFYYCFSRTLPFSTGRVESPTAAFDYVLYLACALFGIELAYLETRFGLLGQSWDLHLLFSAGLYSICAYRFDNRLVLSLALSTLAGWFGVRLTRHGLSSADALRASALAYAAVVTLIGASLHRAGLKRHFFETYLQVAAIAAFVALLSGTLPGEPAARYLPLLLLLGAIAVAGGVRCRRFSFVAYGVLFPYLGISIRVVERMHGTEPLTYGLVSATVMAVFLVYGSRRLGAHE